MLSGWIFFLKCRAAKSIETTSKDCCKNSREFSRIKETLSVRPCPFPCSVSGCYVCGHAPPGLSRRPGFPGTARPLILYIISLAWRTLGRHQLFPLVSCTRLGCRSVAPARGSAGSAPRRQACWPQLGEGGACPPRRCRTWSPRTTTCTRPQSTYYLADQVQMIFPCRLHAGVLN